MSSVRFEKTYKETKKINRYNSFSIVFLFGATEGTIAMHVKFSQHYQDPHNGVFIGLPAVERLWNGCDSDAELFICLNYNNVFCKKFDQNEHFSPF